MENSFSALGVVTEVEIEWENLKNSIKESVEETIPLRLKQEHKKMDETGHPRPNEFQKESKKRSPKI